MTTLVRKLEFIRCLIFLISIDALDGFPLVLTSLITPTKTALFPDLTYFRLLLPVLQENRDRSLPWELSLTGSYAQSRRIPKLLIALWFSYKPLTHILPSSMRTPSNSIRLCFGLITSRNLINNQALISIPSQYAPNTQVYQWLGPALASQPTQIQRSILN